MIPLPHQLYALSRAMPDDRIRYLLADEVGLGKTIEAGLVFRELKLRGLVKRVLVVAPKGIITQWVQEMKTHFNEEFQLLTPGEFSLWRNLTGSENVWRHFDQVVCPIDAIKPVEKRRGWTREKLEAHNQERLGDLIDAGWDLIICDEAHRLGGSTDLVARYRLGKVLADAAPFLLLLTATPHQGKTDSFQRIMALLDRDEFFGPGSVRKEKVVRYVIRTEKRQAINERGDALFMPRMTKLVAVTWQERHQLQKQLYESVTEYVRLGYDQAIRQNRQYLGFLMLLMQRMVTSSTRAIATAMERRLDVLNSTNVAEIDEEPVENDLREQDAQQQWENLLAIRLAGLKNEKSEVGLLLDLARRCEAQGPDARAETLLDILYDNQREENNPELKFLIFTEFVPTQEMLREFLEEHGFTVVCLNGSMDLDQRRRVQQSFAEKTRILVSTDAGGEGLNLQFAHVVINYDLPWNPMRIEQRIGRVDRIGLHDDGRILVPTARRIWDCLLDDRPAVNQLGSMPDEGVAEIFHRLRSEAERQGQAAFDELHARHQQRLKREQDKSQDAFQVRRDALNRIGLPEVRQHRLRKLEEEQRAWEAELRKGERVLPELQPVTVLRVEAGDG